MLELQHNPTVLTLGKHVNIAVNCSIGGAGFGFEREGDGYKIPLQRREHPFKVIIEDDVEIGALCVIDRGRWRDTRIGKGTKLDSQVKVAHNVEIGKNCLVVAGTVIGGSVSIGDGCFVGENVSIKQGVQIARNVTIGMGSVVRHNIIEPNSTWAGNPCKKIADVQKF